MFRWLTFRGRVNVVYDGSHGSQPGVVYCLTGDVFSRACVCEMYDRYLRPCLPHRTPLYSLQAHLS